MEKSKINLLKKIVLEEQAAKKFGFYWETLDQLIDQIQSECKEINHASQNSDHENLQEEIGDLMHAAICLCVFFGFDPEDILNSSVIKFQKRFNSLMTLVKEDGKENLIGEPMEVLLSYWDKAKKLKVE